MNIRSLTIRNVYGIISLKMDLGQITVLSGSNAVGKSSIINAIKASLSGGYDPKFVRDPEAPGAGSIVIGEPPQEFGKKSLPHTKGRVELVLSDGSRIVRTVDREKRSSTVEVFSAEGEVVPAPQSFLDAAFPLAAFDPAHFLRADPKDRQKIVMELLDVPLEPRELQSIIIGDWWIQHYLPKESAFPNLDRIEKAARERRTDVNRDLKRINGAIDTLRAGVPSLNDESRDWAKEAAEAEGKLKKSEAEYAAAVADVNKQSLAARQKIWSETDAETTAVDAWLKSEIQKLEKEAETKRAKIMQQRAENIGIVEKTAADYLRELSEAHEPVILEDRENYQAARARLDDYNRADGLRSHLQRELKVAEERAGEASALDKAIENLIALRKKKMECTPIPGMEMRDGIVYYDGLPLDAINTGKLVEVAVRVCVASTTGNANPFLILDGTESIDEENLSAYLDGLKGAGFQVVIGEVNKEHQPLKVATYA